MSPLAEFVFGGVILCEPCYRVTVADSEKAAKPKRAPAPKKKHVPIAPPGTVPSGDVEWSVRTTPTALVPDHVTVRVATVKAQTWFFARAAAMALFMCEASEIVVVRA
jgi:hypothetical protein